MSDICDIDDDGLVCDDQCLIKGAISAFPSFSFLNFKIDGEQIPQALKALELIKNLSLEVPLFKQKEILLEIWPKLIGSAIVYLKSEDIREKYGHDDEDYGVDKLTKTINSFTDFESVFYGADEYYRDHISHMFRVFLLGQRIFTDYLKFDDIKISKFDSDIQISKNEKEAMWCIIALSHDIGYGIGKIPKVNEKLRSIVEPYNIHNTTNFGFSIQNQPLYDFVIKFLSSDIKKIESDPINVGGITPKPKFINHIQTKYYLKFSNQFEQFGHGIISCILLVKNLVYFLESDFSIEKRAPLDIDDSKHYLIRRTILRSIASHDCDDIYYWEIPQFPFLLTIIDEMQDWGRPSLPDLFHEKVMPKLIVHSFSDKHIQYTQVYDISTVNSHNKEKNIISNSFRAMETFYRACTKYRKILRSAVGEDRNICLILSIEIVDRDEKFIKMKFEHKGVNNIFVYIDDQRLNWREYLATFKKDTHYLDTKNTKLQSWIGNKEYLDILNTQC